MSKFHLLDLPYLTVELRKTIIAIPVKREMRMFNTAIVKLPELIN